jgi:hypothetical protein
MPGHVTHRDSQSQRAWLDKQLDLGHRSPEDTRRELLILYKGIAKAREHLPLSVEDLLIVAHRDPLRSREGG